MLSLTAVLMMIGCLCGAHASLPRALVLADISVPAKNPSFPPFSSTMMILAHEGQDAVEASESMCGTISQMKQLEAYDTGSMNSWCRDALSLLILEERGVALQLDPVLYQLLVEFRLRLAPSLSSVGDLRGDIFHEPESATYLVNAARALGPGGRTACVAGFGSGHTALLLLAAAPELTVHAFEGSEGPDTVPIHDLLDQRFPGRLFLYLGDVSISVPRLFSSQPALQCDLVVIEGSLPEHAVRTALFDFRDRARPHHLGGHTLVLRVPADEGAARASQAAWVAAEDRGEVIPHAILRKGVHSSSAAVLATGASLYGETLVGAYVAKDAQQNVLPNGRAQ